jgi:hypothetical protein
MTEPNLVPDAKQRFPFDRIPRSAEGRFFALFISLAVLSWSAGIASFQLNEMRIEREIAAAQKAEAEAKAERLKSLNIEFGSSKYSKFTDLLGGKFKYKFDTTGSCKGSRACAELTIVSKFDCVSADLNFQFTLKSGEIVSKVNLREEFVSSLTPFDLYFESTNSKKVDYVELVSASCNGESF